MISYLRIHGVHMIFHTDDVRSLSIDVLNVAPSVYRSTSRQPRGRGGSL